jgi:hypothetical protein
MSRTFVLTVSFLLLVSSACESRVEATEPSIAAERVADMVHAVVAADRSAYTKQVVNRLVGQQAVEVVDPESKLAKPLAASEQWKSEHGTLPLPAQMFRLGAEAVAGQGLGFTYALLSSWPINSQNKPKTPLERAGLSAVASSPQRPYYGREKLGDVEYFTAVYADVAIAPACATCHNQHRDSPRRDFKVGDVMGGVVIRLPLSAR